MATTTHKKKKTNIIRLSGALLAGTGAVTMAQVANADTVTVKSGQSITSIAKDNNVDPNALAKANNLESVNSVIHPNQTLTLPTKEKAQNTKYYTVKSGDTISQIAKNHHMKTEKLLKLNKLSWQNSTIYINQKLKLNNPTKKVKTKSTKAVSQAPQAVQGQNQNITVNPTAGSTQGQKAVNLALQLTHMNIPYVWGGETTSGMDCSGLVKYVYAQLGYSLPHNTVAQEAYINYKPVSQAQPGDLLFWGGQGSSYHVAIYIGDGKFVAAPTFGQNVSVGYISEFAPSFAGSLK